MSSFRHKNRSRSPRRDNGRMTRYVSSTNREPIRYDYSKFDESPKHEDKPFKIVNQLTTDALRKDNNYMLRSNRNLDSGRYRNFTTNKNSNQYNYGSDRKVRDNRRSSPDRRNDRRQPRVKSFGDEPSYNLGDSISVPRRGYYFEHDNRMSDYSPERHSHRRKDDSRRSEFSSNTRSAPRIYSNGFQSDTSRNHDRTNSFWRHDKFEEMKDDKSGHQNNNRI